MNIKDSYLHGGTHVVKNINFLIAASGTNQNKLVATITWAEEGSSNTELAIPISGATFGSQTKNTVFAAPNGSNGVPSFRTLVAADIPNISANKITSDTLGADRLPLATNSAKGAVILGVAKTSDADSAITGKKYWVKMNANGKLFIDVPWNDNTHYTAVPILGGTDATSNATSDTANDSTYLNIIENSAKSGGIKITGSGATTVKANTGVLTINSTNTWKAANNSQEGYVPKLVSGGANLADSANDYVLAFVYSSSGTLTPSWKKLPAKAYTWRGIQDNLTSSTNTTESLSAKQGYLLANGSARDNTKLPLAGGTMNSSALLKFPLNSRIVQNQNDTSNYTCIIQWMKNSTGWYKSDGTTLYAQQPQIGQHNTGDSGTGAIIILPYPTDTSPWNGNVGLYIGESSLKYKGNKVWHAGNDGSDSGLNADLLDDKHASDFALNSHTHAYTDLTGSSTTANQAIVSSGTANEWTLKTLGSRAFDSTAYVPIAGGTMTGVLHLKGNMYEDAANKGALNLANSDIYGVNSIKFSDLSDGASEGLQWYRDTTHIDSLWVKAGVIYFTPNRAFGETATNYTVYHSGNIPSNSASAKGVVPAGVASSVYMTDASKNPSWTSIDSTVTSGSSHLVTSGAVYTAIANNVASAVQYQGTIASEADMIALTSAGQGDFARVTTEFTFTDASGASVTAHVGDVVYLTNNTPGTSSNWIVAHTEIDTNTWTAASTSAAGYVPKLATGGANLAAASTDYVLAYINGATTPSWLKLPANAYKNDNTTGIKLATVSGTKKTDSTLISIGSGTGLSIAGGTNKFSIGNGTNYIEVSVAHGLSTKNISINGTNYALYTSASSLPTIKAPTGFGTANQILATNADATGLTWVDKPATNVTTSLYVGASDGTSTAAQTAGNVHLILKEGSSYTRYKITGSGRASVTSDASGTITINSAGYSNFVKSGSTAAAGLVPSPGTTAGTGKFLCEDGTWKTPSYTTNTDEKVKQSETSTTDYRGVVLGFNSNAAANTGVSETVTNQVYISNNLTVQPSTGSVVSLGRGTFAGLTSSNGDLIFNATNHILWNNDTYKQRIFLTDDSTTDTAVFTFQQSSDSGSNWSNLMTIRDNGKVIATTFVGALSGNATTATNLSKTSGRGYLYQSANTTTACTGVGSVTAVADIGIPYIGYASNANTYGIYKDLFYLSGSTKYIGNDIHSNKFACVKTKDSVTDDWTGSSTSGQQSGSGTTYSAGDGISINNGTISTTRKEWYGTEAQFNSLSSLDNNTTYYIMAT